MKFASSKIKGTTNWAQNERKSLMRLKKVQAYKIEGEND